MFKKEEMQRQLANAGSNLGVEQPTNRHLVQPIAWRRPDLGLNPQLQVPLRARRAVRQDRGNGIHVEA